MSNELVISENSGAAPGGPATGEGHATGAEQVGASLPAGAGRIAEIQQVMATDIDRYYAEGLDREYLELLQSGIEAANPDTGTPTAPMPADVARVSLCGSKAGQALVYSWERMGGFRTHLEHVQRDVGEIVREVGDNRAQRVFLETFSRSVPVAAEIAMMDEIASGAPTFTPPADEIEMSLFRSTPAGKLMVSEWGSEAPQRVAIVQARARRMMRYMDQDDAADFWAWFEGLDTAHIMKIYRKMAG